MLQGPSELGNSRQGWNSIGWGQGRGTWLQEQIGHVAVFTFNFCKGMVGKVRDFCILSCLLCRSVSDPILITIQQRIKEIASLEICQSSSGRGEVEKIGRRKDSRVKVKGNALLCLFCFTVLLLVKFNTFHCWLNGLGEKTRLQGCIGLRNRPELVEGAVCSLIFNSSIIACIVCLDRAILLILINHDGIYLMRAISSRRKRKKKIPSPWGKKCTSRTVALLGLTGKKYSFLSHLKLIHESKKPRPCCSFDKCSGWLHRWWFNKKIPESFLGMYAKQSSLMTLHASPVDTRRLSNVGWWWETAFWSPCISQATMSTFVLAILVACVTW